MIQNNHGDPLVSIITVVYNGERYLADAIESVIIQGYYNIEYIVIDGGSNDATLDIIKRYEKYISYWVSEKDNGIYDAMNKGVNVARGDIVGFIHSDDYYEDADVVENVVEVFKKMECHVVFGDIKLLDIKNGTSKRCSVDVPKIKKEVNLSVVFPANFVKRIVYDVVRCDNEYTIVADRDFFYKTYDCGYNICKINKILATMRTGGLSSSFIRPLYEGILVRSKHLGIKDAVIYAIKYSLSHLRRCIKGYT